MRDLTDSEIVATAYKYIPKENWSSPFEYMLPKRDKNEMCPYCKNEDTNVVTDQAFLNRYKKLFKNKEFKVLECHCCSSIFSWVK